jgi:hypothetical protein
VILAAARISVALKSSGLRALFPALAERDARDTAG